MSKIVTLDKISYRTKDQIILQDISFDIEENSYLTLSGPSGSGKSTLLKIIASLVSPTSGQLFFEGTDVETLDPINYRRVVSYCFQQPALFGETVADNLQFPFQIRQQNFDQKKALAALEKVALPATYLNKKIIELSGGERQRVALIRNLLFPPKLLLLDEVTTGLDSESKQVVHQLINELNQKNALTIIAITHDEQEIKQASLLKTIEAGKLVANK